MAIDSHPLDSPARALAALQFIPSDCDRETWVKVGTGAKAAGVQFVEFDAWSSTAPSYNASDCKATWRSIQIDGGIGPGTLFHIAKANGWHDTSSERPTPEALAERNRTAQARTQQADRERQQHQQQAANASAKRWAAATPATEHPYLIAKGVQAHGLKLEGAALLIPMRDTEGTLHSLQVIDEQGSKRFAAGGRTKGCLHLIGAPKGDLIVCEGYATGASIHEATGLAVAVAFTAGNLLDVAHALRSKYPALRLIAAADDDHRTLGNPGLSKARQAAQAVGALLAVPRFPADRPDKATDFNDLHQQSGLEAVAQSIASASAPAGRLFPSLEGELGAPEPSAASGSSVTLVRGDAITPEAVRWIWNGWLAAGKFHVFGGAPGTGKTTIALALAAVISRGGFWPDGTRCEAGNVVIWSGEDDPADTLVPRLIQAGADVKRIFFVGEVQDGTTKRAFDPARDMEPLRRTLEQTGNVRLLIVDPIVSAVQGDSHKNAEVRRSLQPLADLAAHLDCALLGITHFSKGTGGRDPVERLTGSLAFGALARVVLVAAKQEQGGDDDAPAPRLFCRAKSNIGSDAGGFEYELAQAELARHPGVFTSAVVWGKALEGSARDLLREADASSSDEEGGTLADAKLFLASLLADGPLPAKAIMADARQAGHSEATIRRAKQKLGIESEASGGQFGGKGRVWKWALPAVSPQGAQVSTRCPTKKAEHLVDSVSTLCESDICEGLL